MGCIFIMSIIYTEKRHWYYLLHLNVKDSSKPGVQGRCQNRSQVTVSITVSLHSRVQMGVRLSPLNICGQLRPALMAVGDDDPVKAKGIHANQSAKVILTNAAHEKFKLLDGS